MLMDQFLTAAEREGLLPFGAEVCRNGKVTEHWEQTPGRRYPVYSAAKSFTSTAVGLAVDEGKMALEDPLEKFFPQELDRAGGTSGRSVETGDNPQAADDDGAWAAFPPVGGRLADGLFLQNLRYREGNRVFLLQFAGVPGRRSSGTCGRGAYGGLSGAETVCSAWNSKTSDAALPERAFFTALREWN